MLIPIFTMSASPKSHAYSELCLYTLCLSAVSTVMMLRLFGRCREGRFYLFFPTPCTAFGPKHFDDCCALSQHFLCSEALMLAIHNLLHRGAAAAPVVSEINTIPAQLTHGHDFAPQTPHFSVRKSCDELALFLCTA